MLPPANGATSLQRSMYRQLCSLIAASAQAAEASSLKTVLQLLRHARFGSAANGQAAVGGHSRESGALAAWGSGLLRKILRRAGPARRGRWLLHGNGWCRAECATWPASGRGCVLCWGGCGVGRLAPGVHVRRRSEVCGPLPCLLILNSTSRSIQKALIRSRSFNC